MVRGYVMSHEPLMCAVIAPIWVLFSRPENDALMACFVFVYGTARTRVDSE